MPIETNPLSGAMSINLGLFSEAVLGELHEMSSGDRPQDNSTAGTEALVVAVESLKLLLGEKASISADPVFNSYDELYTLKQVLREQGDISFKDIESMIANLLANRTTDRRGLIERLKNIFDNISRRALANARFPKTPRPDGVKKLAALTT